MRIKPAQQPPRASSRELRLLVRPAALPDLALDVTAPVTRAVAEVLWRCHGGNHVLNWLEAEMVVQDLLAAAGDLDPGGPVHVAPSPAAIALPRSASRSRAATTAPSARMRRT
jgi:hypothetical protein